jgi:hypothetical protein
MCTGSVQSQKPLSKEEKERLGNIVGEVHPNKFVLFLECHVNLEKTAEEGVVRPNSGSSMD